jgi:CRP-like cAMP-binding protein
MSDEPGEATRTKAIQRLKRELQEDPASTALSLQLADLLVESGRASEAVPVFLSLADAFTKRGLVARAAAALRRVEAIEPGRSDVASRRALLQERMNAALFTDTVSGPRPGRPDEDTKPIVHLPGGPGSEAPAPKRPRREAAKDEEFLSMPEEAVQDQLEDLIEGLYLPQEAPDAAQPPETPAESESGLSGLLFSELPPEERRAILGQLKLRAFEPGDILVTEGEVPAGLTLLTAGGLRLHSRDSSGRNRPVGLVEEGDFFGEVASLPDLPRGVTVVATAPGEMLELDQDSVDRIALEQPRVWARMHAVARERAAARTLAHAAEELPGEGASEPRVRLGMVKAFLRAGQQEEARRILLDLADDLVRRGHSEKAIALLKRVENLGREGPKPEAKRPGREAAAPAGGRRKPATDDRLSSWISGLARSLGPRPETPRRPRLWAESLADPETLRAQAGLRACRLFDGLEDEQLLAFVQELPIENRGPGEILMTEGEASDSVLLLARGRVKVFVRQRSGRDGLLRDLGEGAFLGEIGVFSDRPRTATATTAKASVILRVDKRALEELCRLHPPTRAVLEEAIKDRSSNPAEGPLRERILPDD